jgi:hypothetical protein
MLGLDMLKTVTLSVIMLSVLAPLKGSLKGEQFAFELCIQLTL